MSEDNAIFVGASDADQYLLLKYGNRHGLIAGATGTGKTVTLQTIAEGFSAYGVPVFMADVKGDLSGIGQKGGDNPRALERAKQLKIDGYGGRAFPVAYWDFFGQKGHPIRTTVSEVGPVLMARLLQLNETQEGVLNVVFKVADEQGLLLLDFKDLQAMLQWAAENAGTLTAEYGNVSKASVGTIQRQLLTLEQQGGKGFFGEPALDLGDMIQVDRSGAGVINVLAADRLMQSPKLYATGLLWLLSELFERLPEVGDLDKPKFVFFFDEAHLLFDDAPKALLERIEQVVRLIRSKGVGVYFVTQNPLDIPESVLGQLSNRVQHALRAFTPRDQKAVKVAAETFRPNPKFKAVDAIQQLGVGEALLSFLDAKGVPEPVERCLIAPPQARIGPVSDAERAATLKASPLSGKYDTMVDRASAYEVLMGRASGADQQKVPPPAAAGGTAAPAARRRGQYGSVPPTEPPPEAPPTGPWGKPAEEQAPAEEAPRAEPRLKRAQPQAPQTPAPDSAPRPRGRQPDSIGMTAAKAAMRSTATVVAREASKAVFGKGLAASIGSQVGGSILRGVLGSILKR